MAFARPPGGSHLTPWGAFRLLTCAKTPQQIEIRASKTRRENRSLVWGEGCFKGQPPGGCFTPWSAFRLLMCANTPKKERSRVRKRPFRCRHPPVFDANAKVQYPPLPPLGEPKCHAFSSYLSFLSSLSLLFLFFFFLSLPFFLFFPFPSSLSLLLFLFFSFSLSLLGGGRREVGGRAWEEGGRRRRRHSNNKNPNLRIWGIVSSSKSYDVVGT